MTTAVQYQREGDLARITLNRPHRHNALVPELLDGLRAAVAHCLRDQPAALILDAEGRSFSTGGDVGGFYDTPRAERHDYAARVVGTLNAVILDLLSLPLPTVVAVHGMVTGGSAGLVLACDIAVAGPKASFAPWYTAVGYSPDGGWTALMPERIGRARALDIQLTNRRVDAEEAHRLGLVQYLTEEGHLADRTRTVAEALRAAKPGSVRHTLALTRPDLDIVAAGLDAEYRHFLEQIVSDEADQGMATFLNKL
ncbi:enoyl-CoA hydratase/isomerase family protein [uncultured Marinobacter sp.]|uniref:enoyl-CoA hydratase/isomerase family protein n=1 Tax=uncultured Marinobacter sp. TaxID=187379 RepID=UPI0030DC485F|tara:strand:- start:34769 stop:35530 length:762 start_codon:yes stop_codon:yes gene_type:complete